MKSVVIIGGGAAGLMSAIALKRDANNLNIIILEKNDRVGKKIAVTGNGRCNLSNRDLELSHFHGQNPQFAKFALEKFNLSKTEHFFNSIGIIFKEENGKLFPYSLQASSVTDALRFEAERLGIKTVTNECVEKIIKNEDKFKILANDTYFANAVIVATGSVAGGKLGCDLGYKLLNDLSHTSTKLSPAIVQVKTDNRYTKALKGVKVIAKVTVENTDCKNYTDFGEVLFCDYGLSGPPIMQLSRYMHKGCEIHLDIMPDIDMQSLTKLLNARNGKFSSCKEFFCGMLHSRLGQTVLKICGFSINDSANFTAIQLEKIAKTIKNMIFLFTDRMGFSAAQVTNGGIKTDEFYSDTLMSKKVSGLFACGELLDIDGDCGGYNLQWAWSSGYVAGLGVKQYLEGK